MTTGIKWTVNPVQCKYSQPFDYTITNPRRRNNYNYEYEKKAVLISTISCKKLAIKANYVEIENATLDTIDVTGNLYLHDCESDIERVSVTENLFIYRCSKINHIVATQVFVATLPPGQHPQFKYESIDAEEFNKFSVNNQSNYLRIENSQGVMNLDENYMIVDIVGDCSKIPLIHFQGHKRDSQCIVTVKKGALFFGEVLGGILVRED